MSERKCLAIIGAGEMACTFAKKAKDIGVRTICFAWDEGALARELVDRFYPISIFEKEKIVEICKQERVSGVVSTTELTISICSYIQEKLGVTVNISYINSLKITNKGWVRDQAKNCTFIHHPAYVRVTDSNYDWNSFPAIVKPASEGGKRGIIVVNNQNELSEALQYSRSYDKHNNGVIIESFLSDGQEYSVEGLSYHGKHTVVQVTEKISSGPPHCVELGHHQPANVPETIRNRIFDAITELLDAVKFNNGPTHTEIKVENGQVYLIELNARPGGDFISDTLTQLSTGYDYLSEAIRVSLGYEPNPMPKNYKKYCGVYFITKQTAYLKPFFDKCDNEKWLYRKHIESDNLSELLNNDDLHQNYMIYYSDERISFQE